MTQENKKIIYLKLSRERLLQASKNSCVHFVYHVTMTTVLVSITVNSWMMNYLTVFAFVK